MQLDDDSSGRDDPDRARNGGRLIRANIHGQKGNLGMIRRQPALPVVKLVDFQAMLFAVTFLGQGTLAALFHMALLEPALLNGIGQVMILAPVESTITGKIASPNMGLFG
ncbi:MAG: hypothetical protein GY849_15385 [Deltaproteobacteria bacterium]|nr:hypothetical protein [Deltaproteobacteria bacterium]